MYRFKQLLKKLFYKHYIKNNINVACDPVLENNSWLRIKQACEEGDPILSTWLGQTKSTTYNGISTAFRLVDTYVGRYKFNDNSDNHAVFEMVNATSNSFIWTNGDNYGYRSAAIKNTYDSTNYNFLADDLKPLLKNTIVYSTHYMNHGSAIDVYAANNCKIFPISICENYVDNTYWRNESTGGMFEYYKNGGSRVKTAVGGSEAVIYWTRSSGWWSDGKACVVGRGGGIDGDGVGAASTYVGSICFAF